MEDVAGNENIPTLASLRLAFGEGTDKGYMKLLLTDLFNSTEQPLGVRPERIDEAAQLMASNYHYLNLGELMHFSAKCKLAKYGTFFGVTGPMQVAKFLNDFCKERETAIQAGEARKHNERIQEPKVNEYELYLQQLKEAAESGDKAAQEVWKRHNK